MQNAAAGWLMTGLDPDPLVVSLVQVATSLPMFVFALPAGALADIVDRRRLLIVVQTSVAVLVAGFGLLVWLGRVTPSLLLAFTFVAGTAAALIAPAWQSIVPQLVPRQHLQPAVALNSVGLNISRAVGPALAGIIIVAWGLAAPFWLNAISTVGVIAALIWWRPTRDAASRRLPAERFDRAIRAGLRHARHNPHLRATLIRAAGFFVFASAYWALLPLLARDQVAGGPQLYGTLLGMIGAGAVIGAFALPWLKRWLRSGQAGGGGHGRDRHCPRLVRHRAATGHCADRKLRRGRVVDRGAGDDQRLGAGRAAGLGARPRAFDLRHRDVRRLDVRQRAVGPGRGDDRPSARPLRRSRRRNSRDPSCSGAGSCRPARASIFTPSMHWPEPVLSNEVDADRGPVLVTVEYRVATQDRGGFLAAIDRLADERRRDGAFDWGLFEDAAEPGRFLETFLLDSWIEHLRQHERVTEADRALQDAVHRLQLEGAPKVTHLIAVELGDAADREGAVSLSHRPRE